MNTHELMDQSISIDELKARFCIQGNVQVAGMMYPPRVGVASFSVRLEYEHFKPQTPANDEFLLAMVPFQSMLWSLMSFPEIKLEDASRIAAECGLALMRATPLIFQMHGFEFPVVSCLSVKRREEIRQGLDDDLDWLEVFPIDVETLYTLESANPRVRFSDDVTTCLEHEAEIASLLGNFFKEIQNG